MAYIILPSRRTRIPAAIVRPNNSHPLTSSIGLLVAGSPFMDIVGKKLPISTSGTASYSAGSFGSCRYYNQGSDFFTLPEQLRNVTDWTLFLYAEIIDYASWEYSSIGAAVQGTGGTNCYGTAKGGAGTSWIYASHATNEDTGVAIPYFSMADGLHAIVVTSQANVARGYIDADEWGGSTIPLSPLANADTFKAFTCRDYVRSKGKVYLTGLVNRAWSSSEAKEFIRNPLGLIAPDPRRLYFAPSGAGTTIITASGAASLVARAAAAVAATKTAAAASRAAIAGTASTTSIRTSALVAKARSAGAAATTTLRTATIAARTVGAGTAATITLRTGLAAGRLTSNAQTTYAAIIAGAFTAAGRTSARGTAAYASTHTATAAATATTSGAAAATTLREGIAVARVDARAAVTAAALVAGTITTTAAAQISARASVSNTTERSAALAAMLALRGANPAAPELPVIVPPSTRTLSPDHTRLGLSPVAPAKPRLG